MGGSGKGKHVKGKGKSKVRKSSYNEQPPRTSISDSNVDKRKGDNEEKGPDPDVILNADMNCWKNKSEDELEKLLAHEIDSMYVEAFEKLLALGYDGEVAKKAIEMNGHAFGNMNILNNVVINSYSFIISGSVTERSPQGKFKDWCDRVKSLRDIMVSSAHEAHPGWSKSDAIKHLLAINTHVGIGSIQPLQSENENNRRNLVDGLSCDITENKNDPSVEKFDAPIQKDLGLPKRYKLKPGMESLLKKNVETIAAIYRPHVDASPTYAEALHYCSSSKEPNMEDIDFLKLAGCSENSSPEECLQRNVEDPRNELILSVIKQHKDLKKQVLERKEWALRKAQQAEEKLSRHLSELKMLRIEKLENEVMKINQNHHQEKNVKKIMDTEYALWNTFSQLELANVAIKRLEMQSSNIRADLEAHNLSTSSSNRDLQEVEKRKKKWLKKVAAIERELNQLHEQIEEQKQEVLQCNQELLQLHNDQKEAEEKWKEQVKEKELAIALVAEEEMLRKRAEANLKSKHASLDQKMNTSCQPLRDNVHRLEVELANLQSSLIDTFEMAPPESCVLRDTSGEGVSYGRACIICSNKEASVLFLPCAHQVVCSKCNEERAVGERCPCCQTQIEERINICGTSS